VVWLKKEWIEGIRTNQQPICNIDRGFEKAISAHIVTIALNDNGKKYIGMNKKDYCFVEAQRNNYYIIF